MKPIALLLKVSAVVIGIIFLIYGLLGLCGWNPAGRHGEGWIRLLGLTMMILGALYLIPNSRLIARPKILRLVYLVLLLPFPVVWTLAMQSIIQQGWDAALDQGVPGLVLVASLAALPAPGSLFLFERGRGKPALKPEPVEHVDLV